MEMEKAVCLPRLDTHNADALEVALIDLGHDLSMEKDVAPEVNVTGNCLKEFAPGFIRSFFYSIAKQGDKYTIGLLASGLVSSFGMLLGMVIASGVPKEKRTYVIDEMLKHLKEAVTHFVENGIEHVGDKPNSPEEIMALIGKKNKTLH